MSVSKQQGAEFLAKMKDRTAAKPPAPLSVVKDLQAPVPPAAGKKKVTFTERTMSFKLAEADYEAIEDVLLKRKRAGEKGLTNKDAGREMVRAWLKKHGVEAYDYSKS